MHTNMIIGTLSESHNKAKALLECIKKPYVKKRYIPHMGRQ